MKICCNSDYCGGTGDFISRINEIAEAGFTHYFWCHQWCTDFIYTACEYAAIRKAQKSAGLKLLDIHGSAGQEKCWFSPVEYIRQAGVELVKNRIEMLSELEGEGVIVMHAPARRISDGTVIDAAAEKKLIQEHEAVLRSLDELMLVLEKHNVRLAIENLIKDDWTLLDTYLERYPAERLGICYDCGHANIFENRMHEMEKRKSRIIATHLHDNNGQGDQHKPVFTGTIDFEALAKLIATSSYKDLPPSFEISLRSTSYYDPAIQNILDHSPETRRAFLKDAYQGCLKLAQMIEAAK